MKVYEYIPRYTYSDYAKWEGHWELIYGYPHAMSPSPNRKHQFVSLELAAEIRSSLKGNTKECGHCKVYQDLDWIITEDTVVRPDIMVVCGKMEGDFLTFAPVLVIEIISPSSLLRDKNVKHQVYGNSGVKYYAIVNPKNKTTEIFELVNGEYIPQNTLGQFALHNDCVLNFNISSFVQELKLD